MGVEAAPHTIALLLALFALWSPHLSIEPRQRPGTKTQPADRKPHLKIDASLVPVPFTVTDRLGRPALGLFGCSQTGRPTRSKATACERTGGDRPCE
jgi:hypothetical protein